MVHLLQVNFKQTIKPLNVWISFLCHVHHLRVVAEGGGDWGKQHIVSWHKLGDW